MFFSKLLFLFTLVARSTCQQVHLSSEGLVTVNDHSAATAVNEHGYFLRVWRITPGSAKGGPTYVEPMGFFNLECVSKNSFCELNVIHNPDETSKFNIFYNDQGKIGIHSSQSGLPISIDETDTKTKRLVFAPKVLSYWFDYIPTYGRNEQLYILTTADQTKKLGFIGVNSENKSYFGLFKDGVYAFSICDNAMPAPRSVLKVKM